MADSALVTYGRMIKLSHSVFALPFALAAGVLAARGVPVPWWKWVLVVLCMVTARSSAMGFNRIADRRVDAENPRTQGRELPTGQISVRAAWAFTIGSAALFVLFAGLLGRLVLLLSPVALAVVWGYSFTKRFTALCHLFLGLALALAPTAVWIAFTGSWGRVPALLSLAVGCWVAGFDVIYSLQDVDFDQAHGVRSIPVALGVRGALVASALLHVGTLGALAALPGTIALGPVYWVGWAVIAGVLVYEHAIVTPGDLSRIDKAFFDLNGYVSLVFLAFVWLG